MGKEGKYQQGTHFGVKRIWSQSLSKGRSKWGSNSTRSLSIDVEYNIDVEYSIDLEYSIDEKYSIDVEYSIVVYKINK